MNNENVQLSTFAYGCIGIVCIFFVLFTAAMCEYFPAAVAR